MQASDPPQSRDEIIATLLGLFRKSGFDGVSINDISAATGLGRSSLYYHFPGGKDDMAAAVVATASSWIDAHVLKPLSADLPLAARIDAMLAGVDRLYEGGGKPCLIASMLVGHSNDSLGRSLAPILTKWVGVLAKALAEDGAPAGAARRRALSAIMQVQGALVVGRALRERNLFARTLKEVRSTLLGAG